MVDPSRIQGFGGGGPPPSKQDAASAPWQASLGSFGEALSQQVSDVAAAISESAGQAHEALTNNLVPPAPPPAKKKGGLKGSSLSASGAAKSAPSGDGKKKKAEPQPSGQTKASSSSTATAGTTAAPASSASGDRRGDRATIAASLGDLCRCRLQVEPTRRELERFVDTSSGMPFVADEMSARLKFSSGASWQDRLRLLRGLAALHAHGDTRIIAKVSADSREGLESLLAEPKLRDAAAEVLNRADRVIAPGDAAVERREREEHPAGTVGASATPSPGRNVATSAAAISAPASPDGDAVISPPPTADSGDDLVDLLGAVPTAPAVAAATPPALTPPALTDRADFDLLFAGVSPPPALAAATFSAVDALASVAPAPTPATAGPGEALEDDLLGLEVAPSSSAFPAVAAAVHTTPIVCSQKGLSEGGGALDFGAHTMKFSALDGVEEVVAEKKKEPERALDELLGGAAFV